MKRFLKQSFPLETHQPPKPQSEFGPPLNLSQNSDHPIKSHQENPTPPTDYQWIVPILIGKANIKYKYSDKINILSMNGKIENDPSVLIRVKSAWTFRVHFNFIALNFFLVIPNPTSA